MEFENYADVIDAFERDDMGYENLTAYIEGENIKIKDPGFKDGGLMVAVQRFNKGGLAKVPYDARATTEDMANALRNASGGTDAQKLKDLQNYNINTQAPVQRGLMEEMLKEGYGQTTAPSYASPLGSLEEYMSGFREFEQNNPYSGAGTAVMMPATLPGGFRYNFTGSQQANKFNDYLESIGQAPYERYTDESMINKFNMGGMAGDKTYHQVRDQFMPMDSESMGYANGGGIGTMMKPKKKVPQLVTPNKDGSRPGYRGPGGYQGGSTSSSSSSTNSGPAGGQSSGGNYGGGSSGNNNQPSGDDYRRSKREFVQKLNNDNAIRANQAGTKFEPYRGGSRPKGFFAPNGGLSTLTRNANPMNFLAGLATGNPIGILASLFSKGFTGLKGLNSKLQNSDFGQSKTLVDYFNRKKNKNFTNTGKTTSQLQAEIDAGKFDGAPKTNVIGSNGQPIMGNEDGITNYEFDQEDGITNYDFDPEMTMQEYLTDQASFQPAATGVMKPGGYPVNSGSIPFNPGMGSAPIGLQYPGREPNFEQDMMEQDAGMYSGLPNQKAVNAAAMEVMSNAYKENYPYTQDDFVPGSPFDNPTSIYEAPYGLTNPNVNELTGENYFFNDGNNLASLTNNELPANDIFAFNSGSKRDRTLKALDNQVQEGLFMNDANKLQYEQLLQEDLDSGQPLSLPKNRYIT